jgi:predicted transcriptional regulator
MNKIVLLNVRELMTDNIILPQADYKIEMTAQRVSEEKEDQDSDDEPVIKYRLKVVTIDDITCLKDGVKLNIGNGKTSSQKQKFFIDRELGKDSYNDFMKWLLPQIPRLCEEYRER